MLSTLAWTKGHGSCSTATPLSRSVQARHRPVSQSVSGSAVQGSPCSMTMRWPAQLPRSSAALVRDLGASDAHGHVRESVGHADGDPPRDGRWNAGGLEGQEPKALPPIRTHDVGAHVGLREGRDEWQRRQERGPKRLNHERGEADPSGSVERVGVSPRGRSRCSTGGS
jgi:hypothetical protein